ncbi:MAG: hypothetical protein M3N43_00990 [Actinomycetota bacterium]|nr:hypothetical protein [Actinomycetota bacterium]
MLINNVVEMGDLLLIDTDRSFTGQDGAAITPDSPGDAVPGMLAERLFALDPSIDYVYVLQNAVTVRRSENWDEASKTAALSVVEGFLLFY